jgi:hypothetical protein
VVVYPDQSGRIVEVRWIDNVESDSSSSSQPSSFTGMSKSRRFAIQFYFIEQFGAPPPDEWDDFHRNISLVTMIMKLLGIPRGSYHGVKECMEKIYKEHAQGNGCFDPSEVRKSTGGRKVKIEDFTPQADIVYNSMESGLSLGNTLVLLNEWRRGKSMEYISYHALQRFVAESPVMVLEKRSTQKSGKVDPGSNWAEARLEFTRQLKRQINKATRVKNGGVAYDVNEDGDRAQADLEKPLHLDGIVFWDEHHRKIRLGHASKHETRIRRNAQGKVAAAADGGTLPPKSPLTTVKYADEARGCFGAAMIMIDGQKRGVKSIPFNYTGCWLHGFKGYEDEFEKERRRVIPMVCAPFPAGSRDKKGLGYEDLPGAMVVLPNGQIQWKQLIIDVIEGRSRSAIRHVKDLIDHMFKESDKMFKGTNRENDYLIFHDALSVFYEAEAQAYMKQSYPSHHARLIRIVGTTNIGTVFANRPTGDGPELCRALDSHGFADLEYAVSFSCSLGSVYAMDNPKRQFWNQGTPNQLWGVIDAVWSQVAPTPDRVVEDIEMLPHVVDKIIEAKGCAVPDLCLRKGRRALSTSDLAQARSTQPQRNPLARDKISTHKPLIIHPDLREAYQQLLGVAPPAQP